MRSSNIFYWAFSNLFEWTNLRAFFVGSLLERERGELRDLYALVSAQRPIIPDEDALYDFVRAMVEEAFSRCGQPSTEPLASALGETIWQLAHSPAVLYGSIARPDFALLTLGEVQALREVLHLRFRAQKDPTRYVALWRNKLVSTCAILIDHFPKEIFESAQASPFSIPLREVCKEPGKAIEFLMASFYDDDVVDAGLFSDLRRMFDSNLARISGVPLEEARPSKIVTPSQSNRRPAELLDYLAGSPFPAIFEVPLPFAIDQKTRFEGHWIVAPPGRGKTTLLSALFAEDLRREATIIVIDSKGDLLDPIRRMKGLEDRLVILEPDAQHPLALNPLDISRDDPTVAPTERLLRTNRVVSHLEQLFGGLFEAKMTSLQSRFFRIVLRAIVTAAPAPTLATFRDICQAGYEGHVALDKLTEDDRSFFLKEFNTKTYVDTRNQVLWRLGLLLDNPVFKAMFSAPKTKVDMGALMNSRKVVLINNSKALLDEDGAEFFGRFFLALVRSAAQQRATVRDSEKVPVYFYMDECQTVVRRDDNIATIIDECRSQKIALIMAHQRVAQITSANVLDALSNCALRFANSDEDAKYLSVGLRTTPEFLRQPRGSFAAFIRDMTDTAISLRVPNVRLTEFDRMSNDDYKGMLDRIHAQYCVDSGPVVNLHKPDLPWKLEPEKSPPPKPTQKKPPSADKKPTGPDEEYTGPSKY